MPELPEVESARKFVAELCSGSVIKRVVVRELGGGPRDGLFDDLIFEDAKNPDAEDLFTGALLDRKLSNVRRKGKQMWFEFEDGGNAVLFHFGMTGSFAIKDHPIPCYKAFKVDNVNWPPRFTKILMEFSNGKQLAFCDPRRLGRIKIRADPMSTPPLSKLGIDPVTETVPKDTELLEMMSGISAPIKSLLLDQERIFCGIGNYLADEILFQAGIHPATKANHINALGLRAMLDSMDYILATAVGADARYELFPKHWLFHYRWAKAKSKAERVRMPDGKIITFEDVGGRTSAIVSSKQPRSSHFTGALEGKNVKSEKGATSTSSTADSLLTPTASATASGTAGSTKAPTRKKIKPADVGAVATTVSAGGSRKSLRTVSKVAPKGATMQQQQQQQQQEVNLASKKRRVDLNSDSASVKKSRVTRNRTAK